MERKGHPKIKGISLSSSMSRIKKSTGNMSLCTLTNTFSTIPLGYFIDRSASLRDTVVGLKDLIPNFLAGEYGIKLILEPKSHNTLSNVLLPISQGIEKLLESRSFGGSLFWSTAEHSSSRVTVSRSFNFLLFVNISFKNLA